MTQNVKLHTLYPGSKDSSCPEDSEEPLKKDWNCEGICVFPPQVELCKHLLFYSLHVIIMVMEGLVVWRIVLLS